jgi:hypothetical protein
MRMRVRREKGEGGDADGPRCGSRPVIGACAGEGEGGRARRPGRVVVVVAAVIASAATSRYRRVQESWREWDTVGRGRACPHPFNHLML